MIWWYPYFRRHPIFVGIWWNSSIRCCPGSVMMVMMTTMMLMLMTQKRSVVTSMDFPCLFAGFNILSIFDHGCYSIHGNSSMFFSPSSRPKPRTSVGLEQNLYNTFVGRIFDACSSFQVDFVCQWYFGDFWWLGLLVGLFLRQTAGTMKLCCLAFRNKQRFHFGAKFHWWFKFPKWLLPLVLLSISITCLSTLTVLDELNWRTWTTVNSVGIVTDSVLHAVHIWYLNWLLSD